jgi:cytochrome b
MTDAAKAAPQDTEERRVWDLGVRVFHWALTLFVVASWLLGQFGPAIMTLHFQSGYVILGLLAFRLAWGFVGPRHARFSDFLAPPGAVLRYLGTVWRREPSYWPGHNPLGGWAVAAMLALLLAQALTGLFADPDDFINRGPLAAWVPQSWAFAAAGLHHALSDWVTAVIVLHVGAIVFYKVWKREDLVRPMITGRKRVKIKQ